MVDDLSDTLMRLRVAYADSPHLHARTIRWCYQVVRKQGKGEMICKILISTPHRLRWRVLRQFLPDQALTVLLNHLNSTKEL